MRDSVPTPDARIVGYVYEDEKEEFLKQTKRGFWLFLDGNQWCAVGPTFENLAESPAGFGSTHGDALSNLRTAHRHDQHHAEVLATDLTRFKVWGLKKGRVISPADIGRMTPPKVSNVTKINLNQKCRVKLTDEGRKVHRAQHDKSFGDSHQRALKLFSKSNFGYEPPSVDERGYSEFQLWQLFNIFGSEMYMGNNMPFLTEIEVLPL